MSNPYPIPQQGQNQALVLSLNFYITELCLYSLWHTSSPISRVFLIPYIPVSDFRLACSAFNKILSRWLPNVSTRWSFRKGLKTHFSLGGSLPRKFLKSGRSETLFPAICGKMLTPKHLIFLLGKSMVWHH